MSEQVIAEQVKGVSTAIFERAKAAIDKKAAIGNDIDLDKYVKNVPIRERLTTLNELESGIKERALTIGMDSSEANRSGSFFQHDQTVVLSKPMQEGLEVMDINDALEKYEWLKDYFFKLVQPDQDKYTAYSATHKFAGYFL
ncbi:MAG TPA: SufD family Fe-S cluster assembly protein, partial [Methanocellaceae archaeon]